ncbi:hypothetical protein MTO96_013248 [Rhipicephalus appendiculatus]
MMIKRSRRPSRGPRELPRRRSQVLAAVITSGGRPPEGWRGGLGSTPMTPVAPSVAPRFPATRRVCPMRGDFRGSCQMELPEGWPNRCCEGGFFRCQLTEEHVSPENISAEDVY